jgi:hypothetical protein
VHEPAEYRPGQYLKTVEGLERLAAEARKKVVELGEAFDRPRTNS